MPFIFNSVRNKLSVYPRYLQGDNYLEDSKHRRLAGGAAGAHIVDEVVWNPFPHSAHVGIIISSLSQALETVFKKGWTSHL